MICFCVFVVQERMSSGTLLYNNISNALDQAKLAQDTGNEQLATDMVKSITSDKDEHCNTYFDRLSTGDSGIERRNIDCTDGELLAIPMRPQNTRAFLVPTTPINERKPKSLQNVEAYTYGNDDDNDSSTYVYDVDEDDSSQSLVRERYDYKTSAENISATVFLIIWFILVLVYFFIRIMFMKALYKKPKNEIIPYPFDKKFPNPKPKATGFEDVFKYNEYMETRLHELQKDVEVAVQDYEDYKRNEYDKAKKEFKKNRRKKGFHVQKGDPFFKTQLLFAVKKNRAIMARAKYDAIYKTYLEAMINRNFPKNISKNEELELDDLDEDTRELYEINNRNKDTQMFDEVRKEINSNRANTTSSMEKTTLKNRVGDKGVPNVTPKQKANSTSNIGKRSKV